MAKSKKTEPATNPQPGSLGAMAAQTAHILQAQREIAEELETFTSRWIERRSKAAETMQKAAADFGQADQGLGTVPGMLQAWQKTSIDCMAEDASDWASLWSTCATIMTTGQIKAESELAEMAGLTRERGKLPTRIPV